MAGYEPVPYPGVVDYSDLPLLPPWYIPGWTNQNEDNYAAPQSPLQWTMLPLSLTRVEIIGNYSDSVGNPMGGYLTFEQSHDLLVTDESQTPPAVFRVPKRMVGDIPAQNTIAWNEEGSGKIYLVHGHLDVILLANDNNNVMVQNSKDALWVYHVKEYFMRGMEYDIFVPSGSSPVDINTLVIDGTMHPNHDWNRGY